jgi:hypothetical protein
MRSGFVQESLYQCSRLLANSRVWRLCLRMTQIRESSGAPFSDARTARLDRSLAVWKQERTVKACNTGALLGIFRLCQTRLHSFFHSPAESSLRRNPLLLLRGEEKWNTLVSWANFCYLKTGFFKKKRQPALPVVLKVFCFVRPHHCSEGKECFE